MHLPRYFSGLFAVSLIFVGCETYDRREPRRQAPPPAPQPFQTYHAETTSRTEASPAPATSDAPAPTPTPTPSPTPRPTPQLPPPTSTTGGGAGAASTDSGDAPFGVPVPGRPGYVTSPFSPDAGYIDVTGMEPGSLAKDPYTGRVFKVP